MVISKEALLADKAQAEIESAAAQLRVHYINGLLAYLEKPDPKPPEQPTPANAGRAHTA